MNLGMDAYLYNSTNTFVLKNQSVSSTCFSKNSANLGIDTPFVTDTFAAKTNKSFDSNFTSVKINATPGCSVVFLTTESSNKTNSSDQSTQGLDEESLSEDSDGIPFGDQACKRVKTSPNHINLVSEKKPRSFSGNFDEESECSTAYELHSEGPQSLSPQISFGSSPSEQKMEELHLDGKLRHETSASSTEEDSPAMLEASSIAKSYKGSCSRSSCRKSKALFSFVCKLGHSFDLTLEEVRHRWCAKCEKSLNNFREYAASFQGRLLSKYYDEKVTFECQMNHSWSISTKNAKKRWCSQCLKDEKKSAKQQLEDEHRRLEMEAEEVQRKLFENARKQTSQIPSKPSLSNPTTQRSATSQMSMVQYFQRMEQEIDRVAKKKTGEFMNSQDYKGDCTQDQIMQVYKILAMPEEILKSYMLNLSLECLRAEFKRLAKVIHPDKNRHPQAGSAFLRVHKVYESALERLTASC